MIHYESWLSFLYQLGVPRWIPDVFLTSIFIMLCVIIGSALLTRNLKVRNPGRGQVFFEMLLGSLVGFIAGLCPSEKKILTPILGTTFIVILLCNYIGLVPGFVSATSNILLPATLALLAIIFVEFMGFSRKGLSYLKHFVGEPVWLAPLNIPVHIVGEIARPVSLSCRLYGNIYGEEMVISVILYITLNFIKDLWAPLQYIPMQLPFVLYGLFSGFIQAFVFTLLVGLYVNMAVSHEE